MKITANLKLSPNDIELKFITSPGPGGQNVNKVSTGVQLRFNIYNPALSEAVRKRLQLIAGKKISKQGDLILKATRFRTQSRNKDDVMERFVRLLRWAVVPVKQRKKTQLPKQVKQARLVRKKQLGQKKSLRAKIISE